MKKIVCLLITVLMLVTGAAAAVGEEVWDFDTYNYSLDGYNGAGGDVVIPAQLQGCTVDIIGVNVFNNVPEVTSLVLPETVKQIEDGAISFCDGLTSVTLNEGLMVIGDNCFTWNQAMEEITLPASVCYIGNTSFDNCSSLKRVTFLGECPVFAGIAFDWLPEDAVICVPEDQLDAYRAAFAAMELYPRIESTGANAVVYDYTCNPLQLGFDAATGTITAYDGYDVRLDIPAQIDGVAVKAIGPEAFKDRAYLCCLTLPEGVERISASAFEGCSRLLHVAFPSTLRHIEARAFYNGYQGWGLEFPEGLESIGDAAFEYAAKLSHSLVLPQSLKSIGSRAFAYSYWMTEVYIPASVETIGEHAFFDSGVSYVMFEGLQLPAMPGNVFEACDYLADIDLNTKATRQQMLDLQAQVDAAGLECRVWRTQNPDVDYINDGLDMYENGVLTGYTGVQTHVRPWDIFDEIPVTAVGDGAFKGSTTLEYFAVPYNDIFTTIGAEAFADSTIRQIDLFDSVTTIGSGAFRNCVNLTDLTLPESVTFVGETALEGCTGLKKLVVLCDPAVLPETLLADCPADMEIYAGVNATDEQLKRLSMLAGRAFYRPVTRVGEALPVLTAMPDAPLPGEDFWYDEEYARLDSYQGYELNLILPREIDGTALTLIGGGMMQRASSGDNFEQELPVVSLVIPETYTEIPIYAFSNCATLETVVCYAPIEQLNDFTFDNCTALREVIFVNGVGNIGAYVFNACPNLETVYIGQNVQSISEYAFLNEDGTACFSQEACLTDPADMPDVAAMLAAVKREPMAAPEPKPAPVAVPVGEAGAPFVGTWHGREIIIGESVYTFADFDMTMTILLSEDGRMIISDTEEIDISLAGDGDWQAWYVENGVAFAEENTMTLTEDGCLCIEEDGVQMIFVRDGQASAPAISENSAGSEAPADVYGVKYTCVNADVDGYTLDASMLGGEYSMVFHENGTVDFVAVGTAVPGVVWTKSDSGNFMVDYYGTIMEIVWTDTGFDMNYFDTMLMHFAPEK